MNRLPYTETLKKNKTKHFYRKDAKDAKETKKPKSFMGKTK